MSHKETAGVAALGRILSRLATGEALTIHALVDDGEIARSTAFAVVKRMAEAGLVSKQYNGHLVPGKAAGAFAYAGHGLAALHGRAEPILAWLRDETNATVELQACDGASYPTVARFAAAASLDPEGDIMLLVIHRAGTAVARLRLICTSASLEHDEAHALATSAVERLEDFLVTGMASASA